MTGQVTLDSYGDAGVLVALDLMNEPDLAARTRADATAALGRILARDPISAGMLRPRDVVAFAELARDLRRILSDLAARDVDTAAVRLNRLLARHPAHPHLGREGGRWRLHHHPADAALVPMWTAICSEAIARQVGAGHADRFGRCEAPGCGRAFFDESKNATRRFCSTTCQNRVKAAAFRERQRR
jgi:predicted RNA-binding Zn ribbon-like protein